MRVRLQIVAVVAAAVGTLPAASALATDWVGADPAHNIVVSSPPACATDGAAPACVAAGIAALDESRADLGESPYALPRGFASLTPAEQAFVLTDLDRVQVGLPAVPDLSTSLSDDAAVGVLHDDDPSDDAPGILAGTSNWAGAFPNMLYAYQAWMYDDGPGADNLDCTASDSSGCWGHRHDVLWKFTSGGDVAMGADAGADASGRAGYALLIVEREATAAALPSTYTWAQAVTEGANRGHPGPVSPAVTSVDAGTVGTVGTVGTGTGASSPVTLPVQSRTPGVATTARAPEISVGPLSYSNNTLRMTVSMTAAHGFLTAYATDGARRLQLAGRRVGDLYHFARALGLGLWQLTIVLHPGRGLTAPTVNAGAIRIV